MEYTDPLKQIKLNRPRITTDRADQPRLTEELDYKPPAPAAVLALASQKQPVSLS